MAENVGTPASRPPDDLVHLTIDDRPVSVPKGTLVWAAARQLDIEIPIYCYHPKMEPLGACRMCFVEVEKMPKLATACTTVATEGMVVRTNTPKVEKGRRGTLEFLLINHPLDCPICDKGGECDLQDFTLRYGPGGSRFDLNKRHFVKPISVSEDILLDRERCIACQRCVRFTQDIAMENGLVMEERGFKIEVGVDPAAPFDSIFSGNVVEMCPVGALTAKSFRITTRPWELNKTPSVCGNCAVGCNVRVDVRVNKVLRQYSRTNDEIDDGWLCDRGRWDVALINSPERLRTPLIRRDGVLQPASWDDALRLVATRLREVRETQGARAIGGIGSTHTTNEEAYLFQKLLRAGFGTNNIDHFHGRIPAPEAAGLPNVWTGSIAGLDGASHIVLLGTDTYQRQPVVDLRIRKAIRNGARVYVITPEPARLDRYAAGIIRYTAGQTAGVARELLSTVLNEGLMRGPLAGQPAAAAERATPASTEGDARTTAALGVDAGQLRALAREIAVARAAVILYDEMATREPGGEMLAQDVLDLALLTDNFGRANTGCGPLLEDANSLGARDMGVLPALLPGYRSVGDAAVRAALGSAWNASIPSDSGYDYDAMLSGAVKALYVMGADPARHATPEQLARLERLDFLVVQDLVLSETARRAHVVLPAVAYTERDGSFTNTERTIQVVRAAMQKLPGARGDWEILAGVARALGLGWTYLDAGQVLAEIGRTVPLYAGVTRRALGMHGLRWPLAPGEPTAEGKRTVTESPFLTWDMVAHGIARAGMQGGALVAPRGRGE
ncbi:MAG: NADH-quinone oxidoreductase subunit NuoG [Ktedonobacterales bacterium]